MSSGNSPNTTFWMKTGSEVEVGTFVATVYDSAKDVLIAKACVKNMLAYAVVGVVSEIRDPAPGSTATMAAIGSTVGVDFEGIVGTRIKCLTNYTNYSFDAPNFFVVERKTAGTSTNTFYPGITGTLIQTADNALAGYEGIQLSGDFKYIRQMTREDGADTANICVYRYRFPGRR